MNRKDIALIWATPDAVVIGLSMKICIISLSLKKILVLPRLRSNACLSVSDLVLSAFTAVSVIMLQDKAVKLWLCLHPDRGCVCKQNRVGT